jgi:uncharacterized protein (DUF305 family)
MDPLFPWLRDRLGSRLPSPHQRFAAIWSSLAAAGVLVLGVLAFMGWQNRDLPWMGQDQAYDQSDMRPMAAHHMQGMELARIAIEKAQDPSLRNLARLLAASQKGEVEIFEQWWRSWFPGSLPPPSPEEYVTMPGMLSGEQMEILRRTNGEEFDSLFVSLMTLHHKGAILMADEAIREASDISLRLMSHATRHAQRREIELMHGSEGMAAVKAATQSLFLSAGEANAERRGQALPMQRH